MNEQRIKICASCGAEYAPDAQVCADCGGKLLFPEEYEKLFQPLTETDELVLIRQAPIGYINELMEHMRKAGIRAGIALHAQPPGTCSPRSCAPRTLFGLYVTKPDEAAAKEVDRLHWLQGAPEEGSSFRYTEQELQGVCPACGSAVPKGSMECPECGLAVGSIEDVATCPECDAEVGDEVKKCPHCGTEFE
jgi:predicted amidophosphoribosyltransferase